MPEQSDSSATQLNLDDGYGDDGVAGDDFDLPVFGLGFAKLVEEMQLEGFVNEQQSEVKSTSIVITYTFQYFRNCSKSIAILDVFYLKMN